MTRIKRRQVNRRDLMRADIVGGDTCNLHLQPQPLSARADGADDLFALLVVSASRNRLSENRCAGTQALDAPVVLAFGVCRGLNASPRGLLRPACGLVRRSMLLSSRSGGRAHLSGPPTRHRASRAGSTGVGRRGPTSVGPRTGAYTGSCERARRPSRRCRCDRRGRQCRKLVSFPRIAPPGEQSFGTSDLICRQVIERPFCGQ